VVVPASSLVACLDQEEVQRISMQSCLLFTVATTFKHRTRMNLKTSAGVKVKMKRRTSKSLAVRMLSAS